MDTRRALQKYAETLAHEGFAVQEDDPIAFPIKSEQFSPEKSIKDRADLPQALVIMAWLNKTATKLRTIYLDCGSNRSQLGTKLFMVTL